MVVCPCGVMVPAAGVGRARRGPRGPTGCFDSPVTVTTQPKEPQETPASVEKLAAAAAAATTVEPSSIPRPLSRTSKNKGTNNKGPEELKGDLASRTTLALATTESGRYVGTRPLRSNRSPTPTLHRLPQKTISRDSSANGGRSKHLPAIRTSPTAPLDNHNGGGGGGGSRGSTRVKGPASVLPRNNTVNQRMQDLNSNQRR
ncbi:hypothetical protein SK128_018040 [Halocaridina rubra]|uniref:Uncharacterized protein n=1 Tax=Halocaridina rubra TaxID=373956 RepID=A0AAN9A1H9_HALRR